MMEWYLGTLAVFVLLLFLEEEGKRRRRRRKKKKEAQARIETLIDKVSRGGRRVLSDEEEGMIVSPYFTLYMRALHSYNMAKLKEKKEEGEGNGPYLDNNNDNMGSNHHPFSSSRIW